jgi:DNA-binding SARP family transcriptional activator/energy-coupling factor transporter ATP-binding protein EcfA2
MWTFELLGGLRLARAGQVITRFRASKNGSLLAFLAIRRGQPIPRDTLVEAFWPGVAIEDGRNSFRVALNSLRRQLEPAGVMPGSVLQTSRIHVGLNPDAYTTDVAEFEALIRGASADTMPPDEALAALGSAVDLYQGDFMADWGDEWIEPERVRLSEMHLAALNRLVRASVDARQYDHALAYARRAVAADPLHERWHRTLMSLHIAMGNPASALRQMDEMRRVLAAELGAAPSAQSEALAEEARASTGITRAPAARPSYRAEAAEAEPAPLPAPTPKRRLPSVPTRFFGRDAELKAVAALLAESSDGSFVTITGPSGAGKTRLAIELARTAAAEMGDRVWFVELGDARDADAAGWRIAAAVAPQARPETGWLEPVAAVLGQGPGLLALDNLEQLPSAGDEIVGPLLSLSPGVRCVVTSQSRLNIAGEADIQMGPLTLPSDDLDLAEALANPTVALFIDRAVQARADFALTESNCRAVCVLCRLLEGLPLAVELAAAWSQVYTPSQMLSRMADRFALLVSPRGMAGDRRRALHAAVGWSFDLLPAETASALVAASALEGAWTVEQAQAVSGREDMPAALAELCTRSLVRSRPADGGMRFTMYETLRIYAAGRGGEAEMARIRRRHAEHFSDLARRAADAGGRSTLDSADDANYRAAVEWLSRNNEGSAAIALCTRLWRHWYATGWVAGGRKLLLSLLATQPDAPCTAEAMLAAGRFAAAMGDAGEAHNLLAAAVRRADPLADQDLHAAASTELALITDAGDTGHEAEAALAARCAAALARDDDPAAARALERAADVLLRQGRCERAAELAAEAAGLWRAAGCSLGAADALSARAEALEGCDNLEAATALSESEAEAAASDEPNPMAWSYYRLAALAADRGDLRDAMGLLQECLACEAGRRTLAMAYRLRTDVCIRLRLPADAGASLRAFMALEPGAQAPWTLLCAAEVADLTGDARAAGRLLAAWHGEPAAARVAPVEEPEPYAQTADAYAHAAAVVGAAAQRGADEHVM